MAQGPLYVPFFPVAVLEAHLFEGPFFVQQCALYGCILRHYRTIRVGIDAEGLSDLTC